jgi:hypothetical protein
MHPTDAATDLAGTSARLHHAQLPTIIVAAQLRAPMHPNDVAAHVAATGGAARTGEDCRRGKEMRKGCWAGERTPDGEGA